jgi:hypothetical protein
MSKIIELCIDETKAVVGGAATLVYTPGSMSQHAPGYGNPGTGTNTGMGNTPPAPPAWPPAH